MSIKPKKVDSTVEFPFMPKTRLVVCTFEDLGYTIHKVHMMNAGSCVVPNGYTITHTQWLHQQIKESDES